MGIENKLDRNTIENIMSLTSLQQGMLFHYISDEYSNMYHEQLSLTIKGDIKLDLLQKSWQFVIENNEMLRTIFRWKGIEKPVQIVLKSHEVLIEYVDFTNEVEKYNLVESIKLRDLNNRIDIAEETIRVYLCKLDENIHEMIISNHHILYDGWSNGIILKELMDTYTSLYKGRNIEKINKTKFSEFIRHINKPKKDAEKDYWIKYLENLEEKNDCFSCKEIGNYKEISYRMDESKANKIKDFAKANKILLSSILYGAWGTLLQKLNKSNEALFGTTVSGRIENVSGIDKMVGLFINTIPLRVKSENSTNFIDVIRELDLALNERKDFENTSLVDIKEYCGLKGNEELFNSIVTIENYPLDLSLNKENILCIENFSITEKTNYNMTLEILTFNGIEFKFNFNSSSIGESIVEKLGSYLERIIESLLGNPNIAIENIDLLSEVEKNQILYEFNDTRMDYPKDKTIHELFEEQVEKTPDNIAIVFEDKKLTYRELNEKANSLARALRDKGVKADTIVGIMVERSLEMIVGIMGILKAGGAYLPIDPKYPKERIEYMLKDSGSKILLSKNILIENMEFYGETIDLFNKKLFINNSVNLDKINKTSDLAYVIYTSGTTGNPKGVMIEHKQVNNFIHGIVKETKLNIYKSILNITTVCFDIFGLETLVPLTKGVKVVIANEEKQINGEKLSELIKNNNVEIMQSTPSRLNIMLENEHFRSSIKSLKLLLVGGEEVQQSILNKLYKNNKLEIYNVYGPTETTIWSTAKLLNKDEKITVGKPIANTQIYILNNNEIMPIGVTGELCIGGDGLARGYLNRSELTAEKFVDNPFEPGTKMYKTGDLARWLPDGNIEFLGRIDNQVKIRGFRIELGEIENRLLQNESIKEAAVLVKENKDSEKYICAYIVSENSIEELNLKNYLKESLPEYMMPAYFAQLEKMPLTANGKLNRKALPEPNLGANLTEYEAPRNEVEETLAKIWMEVLGTEKVGINDNFFDLGGHSLKATMIMSKIHKELDKEIPLKELFKSPTIKELSKYIESAEENLYLNIEKVEEKDYYEASSAQKRMYMLQQFDKDSTAYNMPAVFELEGKVDKNKIEETFRKLIERHEALRTYFDTLDGEIIQKLQNNYEFKLNHRKENKNIEEVIRVFVKPFDLEKGPLFRIGLVESREKTYLLIDMHHIISDGISLSIVIKDFTELYSGKNLETLRLQYKDFAAWQNNFLESEEMKKQEEYWTNRFSDEIPVLNIPTDYERPAIQSFEGDSVSFQVSEDTTLKLRKLTKETGTTMHMVLLSAYNILLSKYSGQDDIVIGTPIAGRSHADLQNIMGMFVNTLALRNNPEGSKKYIDFLKEVKENSLKAYENQSYQFEALVEKLDVRRDTSRNPLFDVMFNMVDTVTSEDIKLDDIILKHWNNNNNISKFDLTLNALEKNEKLSFTIDYCSKLFKKETIERLSSHYVRILDITVNNTEIKLNEVDLLSEAERNQILYEFNDTKADYPKDKTIHVLFEAQVEKTPDNIAVVFEDKKLTYRELNERSNGLARVLRDKGVKSDTIVGIMAERSLEMIVGIMGILKAGGAYLPIDPNYPKERIEYMLKDSESKILLSKNTLVETIEFDGEVIDLFNENLFTNELSNLEKINNSSNLAYIIYTSGTTGNPKGVMCEHKNVVRLVKNTNYIKFKDDDKILQTGSMVFDASTFEVWGALLNGLELYLAKNYIIISPKILESFITKNNITVLWLTSELFNQIVEENINVFKKLRYLLVGGDVLSPKYISLVRKQFKNLKIVNGYGPTENTTFSTTYFIEKEYSSSIPIGKPISNSKVYVVDKNNMLMPVGIYGQLCTSGDGLARGYLNRLELTDEKFVDNPFEVGTKMYKTGDLARWLPDGNIEFLGRIDNQVKIRGFRIELGEIENRLLQREGVKEAAVLVKENKESEKYICAYVVSDKKLQKLELKSFLKETLPGYMIPSYFVELEKMPLTTNGKLHRRALPEPKLDETLTEYEAPRNEVEEKLVIIWSDILGIKGIKKIGISDDFFDLGGHSLKVTMMASKIHKELNIEMPMKEIFKVPTIKGISEYIKNSEASVYVPIKKTKEKAYYETSSAQKRLYTLQQFDLKSTVYNIPYVFELKGKVNKDKLEKVFNKLVERHEVLRTCFETVDEVIVQKIHDNINFKIDYLDNIENTKENLESLIKAFIRPFNLRKAPLLRVSLIKLEENRYLLIFDVHHIISDGTSVGILTKEFTELYEEKQLKSLTIQYKDYALWQNNLLKSEKIKEKENYWLEEFDNEIPVLNLPYDYERTSTQSFEGNSIEFEIGQKATKNLRRISKETGSTMYMVLLSAYTILLSKYSRQEDIIVGSPIAARSHVDLQNVMGMFANTLAIRNYPKGEKTYIEFLSDVREKSLKSYENQDYQFEELVDKLDLRRDMSRNPLFDVMFVLQNMDLNSINIEDFTLTPYKIKTKTAKFDLLLSAVEKDENIYFSLEYCTRLFKRQTIEKMINHFTKIIDIITEDWHIKLSEIDMITEEEKKQLLLEFNNTECNYPKDMTLQELFEEQVKKTPDYIAVSFENKELTYKELNEKANKIGNMLRKIGVTNTSIVGLMVDRSLEMIIGMMGILKSGGACLPINVDYPEKRIEYMLEDSNANVTLVTGGYREKLDSLDKSKESVIINIEDDIFIEESGENLNIVNGTNDLLYLVYTSGTTGNPKGVMVGQRVINNLSYFDIYETNIDFSNRVLQFSNVSFDVIFQEVYSTMLAGGELCLVREEIKSDILKLQEFMEEKKIKTTYLPATLVKFIFSNEMYSSKFPKCLKHLIVGSDQVIIPDLLKEHMKENKLLIHNHYGPSETHVVTTYTQGYESKIATLPFIGQPISNTKVYIVDDKDKLVPIGVPGELCLSGDCLGIGYLNKKELTDEKFSVNPFELGQRMYRTGDLARWMPDGNIECLGRIDHQVKIRGFRVELGEIEGQLIKHKDIKEVIVLDKKDTSGNKYLCAYVVSDKEIKVSEIKAYLSKELPEYMIPAYIIQIEFMPKNFNIKVDRKALPEPGGNIEIGTEYESPKNETQKNLVRIWESVLNINRIGIDDNFFDLGGHSLKAILVMAKIHKELKVEVPLKQLFKTQTIRGLSEFIIYAEKNPYARIEKAEEKEYYETSSAQKRMYILQNLNKDSLAYNMPIVFEVEGKINKERIEQTFEKLVTRHEALRTYFKIIEDEIVQKINNSHKFNLICREYNKNIKSIVSEFVRPFELEKLPLFRVQLVENKEKTYLLIDMHHIISDGVSMSILIKEFIELYNGKNLEPLKLQYKDFAEWQNKFLESEEIKKQEEYWINRFSDKIPVLNMPTDYERSNMQNFEGNSLSFELDQKITLQLRNLTRETRTTMHMVLLSALNILLSKYSGQEDIIVGTPIAGRPHADLQNIMGVFVNMLALRNKPEGNKKYVDFLKEVKENSLKAYENQSYQFDTLVEKLDIRKDTGRNPLFDVMFNMVDMVTSDDIKLDSILLKQHDSESKTSKLDLTLITEEKESKINLSFEYSTKLFDKETIEVMIEDYVKIIKSIVNDKNVLIDNIELNSGLIDDDLLLELNSLEEYNAELEKELKG